jgi:hypothetical protein
MNTFDYSDMCYRNLLGELEKIETSIKYSGHSSYQTREHFPELLEKQKELILQEIKKRQKENPLLGRPVIQKNKKHKCSCCKN